MLRFAALAVAALAELQEEASLLGVASVVYTCGLFFFFLLIQVLVKFPRSVFAVFPAKQENVAVAGSSL